MQQTIPTVSPNFAKRLSHRKHSPYGLIWDILDNVFDPELPGMTIWDLGVLQDVQQLDNRLKILITPTYSGCPAVDMINQDIKLVLAKKGYRNVLVEIILTPAWSTEMMSPQGKAHLKSIHIAPPNDDDQQSEKIDCPRCNSKRTKIISQFGSTACKALYQCNDCFEAFDYFKSF